MYYLCCENKDEISFAVTAKLICVFVFAYAKSRFSHDETHMYGVPFYYKISIFDIINSILSYHKFDFVISQNELDFVISQIRICDITKSNL